MSESQNHNKPDPNKLKGIGFIKNKTTGRMSFSAPVLAKAIWDVWPVAFGGAQLWIYADGVYMPAERFIGQLVSAALGPKWNLSHQKAVIDWLLTNAPRLWDMSEFPSNVINVRNGLLYLEPDGPVLREHTSEFLSTTQLPVTYDPEARCPRNERFLRQVIKSRLSRSALLEIIGDSTTVGVEYLKGVMLTGPGGNGKSTLIYVWSSLLGSDNVSAVSLHSMAKNRFAAIDVYGKLANMFADLSSNEIEDTNIFKIMTGGDELSGERKFKDSVKFRSYAWQIFSVNDPPTVRDGSLAFRQRWAVFPMPTVYRDTDREDKTLRSKLTTNAELAGLLNAGIDGWYRLRAQGHLTKSGSMERALDHWLRQTDTVLGWLRDHEVAIAVGEKVQRSHMLYAYQDWCAQARRPYLNDIAFHRRLRAWFDEQRYVIREIEVHGSDFYERIR